MLAWRAEIERQCLRDTLAVSLGRCFGVHLDAPSDRQDRPLMTHQRRHRVPSTQRTLRAVKQKSSLPMPIIHPRI